MTGLSPDRGSGSANAGGERHPQRHTGIRKRHRGVLRRASVPLYRLPSGESLRKALRSCHPEGDRRYGHQPAGVCHGTENDGPVPLRVGRRVGMERQFHESRRLQYRDAPGIGQAENGDPDCRQRAPGSVQILAGLAYRLAYCEIRDGSLAPVFARGYAEARRREARKGEI